MAIAFGTRSTPVVGSSGTETSVSVSHDNAGADLLLAFIFTLNDGSLTVTTPTYNSVAITPIGTGQNTQNPGGCVWAGYLHAPSSGSNTFAATITSSQSYVAYCVPVTGAVTSTACALMGADNGTQVGDPSHTNSTTNDNAVIVLATSWRDGVNAPPCAATSPAIELYEDISDGTPSSTTDNVGHLCYRTTTTAGSYTIAATSTSGADRYAAVSFEIQPAAAGGVTQTGSLFNKIESGYGALEGAGMNGRLQR